MWTDGIEEKVNWVKFGEGTWFRFFKFKTSALETYFGSFSQNTGSLPYEPAIWLLGIYPKEINIYVHAKTDTQIFVAALFVDSQELETTQMSFSGWMLTPEYIHTMEYS